MKQKQFWIAVFCAITILLFVFYMPYKVFDTADNRYVEKYGTIHTTIFSEPKDGLKTSLSYRVNFVLDSESIVVREIVIAVICIGGYAFATMKRE